MTFTHLMFVVGSVVLLISTDQPFSLLYLQQDAQECVLLCCRYYTWCMELGLYLSLHLQVQRIANQ